MERTILIVEDDAVFRNYLYQVLKYDYEVTTAPGPLEALTLLKERAFELMITDLRMPDMDGRDLVEKVHREIDPNLMVIVITAFEDDWPMDSAQSTHVFRYLRKGAFLPSELKQNVEKAFEMRGSLLQLEEYQRRIDISDTLYKEIFDKSTDAIFVADEELRLWAVNSGFERLMGYSIGDLESRSLLDLVDRGSVTRVRRALERVLAGQAPRSSGLVLLHKNGSRLKVELWVGLIKDVQGTADAVLGIVTPADAAPKHDGESVEYVRELKAQLEREQTEKEALSYRLERVVDLAGCILLCLDERFVCRYVNAQVHYLLDYEPGDFLGKPVDWKKLLHEGDHHLLKEFGKALSRQERIFAAEARVLTGGGEVRLLAFRACMSYSGQGTPRDIDVAAEDITARKQAEKELKRANRKIHDLNLRLTDTVGRKIRALKDSELRYRHVVEDSRDIIFSLDHAGSIRYMNKTGLGLFGMNQDGITGRPYYEFFSGGQKGERFKEELAVAEKGSVSFDVTADTSQGERLCRMMMEKLGIDGHDEFICVAKDITKEIANSKKLNLLANIEHYSADAIIGLDRERTIISWNRGAVLMFEWREDEIVGKSALILVPDEVKREAEMLMDMVLRKGFVRDLKTRRQTKSGKLLDVMLTMTALKDELGQVFGFSAIIKDITEQKKMEAALIQSERLAATGRLSASIAHEINNPLYGIRSCLTHVLNANGGEVDLQFVRLAIKESDRIADLIRNMKTFYLPSEGRVEKTDLNELMREILVFNRKYLEENMVRVTFRQGEEPWAECMPDQIKQVFLNLISNAVEAMPGGGTLTVETRCDPGGHTISVVFEDTGVGIAGDDLPQIFDMFYTKKPKVKGVGLGLSVSYGIVSRHGGRIEVRSEEGQGTTFTVILPVKTKWGRQLPLELQ